MPASATPPVSHGLGALVGRLIGDRGVLVARRDVDRHRPIAGFRGDGIILAEPQLIAVVAKIPAKIVEHGPGFVAGGTAQTVLAGERGYRRGGAANARLNPAQRPIRNTKLSSRFDITAPRRSVVV